MPDDNQLPNETESVLESETEDTNPDPRHQQRIRLMQALFSLSFDQRAELELAEQEIFDKILDKIGEVDPLIKEHAPERPLADINQVDLAILRLSLYEANYTAVPKKVIINEAVELAKEFGTDSSPRFVNGVLGKILITESEDVA